MKIHKIRITPTLDDKINAYEEAAGHLEYLAGCPVDQTKGEREAMRLLAKRLRTSAWRLVWNI